MKPLFIRVETYDPKSEDVVGTREIDYNNREDRNWFISNFIWAMTNEKALDVMALSMARSKPEVI